MTIKRRLFISNMLMFILPILLTCFIIFCILLIIVESTELNNINSLMKRNIFEIAIHNAEELSAEWGQGTKLLEIESDIDDFNSRYQSEGISLALYKDNEQIYPQTNLNGIIPDAESEHGEEYILITDNAAIYHFSADEYKAILTDTNYTRNNYTDARGKSFSFGFALFIFGLGIILIINSILTRFVIRSVMTPINTLVHGVHQIRDGDLTYRIEYANNDEFTVVCSDFNEMAGHLTDMVNARQKDEISRRELIAGISHDLRTPLTSVKAYLEGIEKGVASTPEDQKRYLDIIKSKTNDLEYIISQLFIFSKLDVGEFPFRLEQIDIGNELSRLTAGHEKEYKEKGLAVSIDQNVKNVYVKIDIVQFGNVIHNILENSLKYKNGEYAESKISCREDDTDVIIKLTDNGPGVSEEEIEKLFDVFYRSDLSRNNPSKGSGLGLAISKKIIERLGGEIHAENVRSGGLAIKITLPKYKGDKN